jgi:hypothetical protein
MATNLAPHLKSEKPVPSFTPLKPGRITVAMTVAKAPLLAYTLPLVGRHAEPAAPRPGKRLMSVRGACFGTAILETHRLVSVPRKDAAFDGKLRDKFIFVLVPAEEYKEDPKEEPAARAALFAMFSMFFVREAFNEAIVYDNGEAGMCVEFRGQTHHQNAYKSFVLAAE